MELTHKYEEAGNRVRSAEAMVRARERFYPTEHSWIPGESPSARFDCFFLLYFFSHVCVYCVFCARVCVPCNPPPPLLLAPSNGARTPTHLDPCFVFSGAEVLVHVLAWPFDGFDVHDRRGLISQTSASTIFSNPPRTLSTFALPSQTLTHTSWLAGQEAAAGDFGHRRPQEVSHQRRESQVGSKEGQGGDEVEQGRRGERKGCRRFADLRIRGSLRRGQEGGSARLGLAQPDVFRFRHCGHPSPWGLPCSLVVFRWRFHAKVPKGGERGIGRLSKGTS